MNNLSWAKGSRKYQWVIDFNRTTFKWKWVITKWRKRKGEEVQKKEATIVKMNQMNKNSQLNNAFKQFNRLPAAKDLNMLGKNNV